MFGTVLKSQTFENYDMDNSGLPSNEVTTITIVDNIIWFGTSEGLASFDGENWNTENINLSSNKISSSSMILGSVSDELIIGLLVMNHRN